MNLLQFKHKKCGSFLFYTLIAISSSSSLIMLLFVAVKFTASKLFDLFRLCFLFFRYCFSLLLFFCFSSIQFFDCSSFAVISVHCISNSVLLFFWLCICFILCFERVYKRHERAHFAYKAIEIRCVCAFFFSAIFKCSLSVRYVKRTKI